MTNQPSWPHTQLHGDHGEYPYNKGQHLLVALELFTYADESGIQGDDNYCIIGALIATPPQWTSFKEQWGRVLSSKDVDLFHARRFFQRDENGFRLDYYKKWTEVEADTFISDLLTIIRDNSIGIGGCAVDIHAFDSLSLGERHFLTGGYWRSKRNTLTSGAPTRPYYLALHGMIAHIMNRVPNDAVVHFYFDRQDILEQWAVRSFGNVKVLREYDRDSRLGSIVYASKQKESPLQAADLYVYSWYRLLSNSARRRITPELATDYLTRDKSSMLILDAHQLESMLAKLEPHVRSVIRNKQK